MKPIDHEMEQGTDKHSQCSKFIPNLSSVYRQFLSHIANHLETYPITASFQVVPWLLAVDDTKNEETITYESAQTSALSWLKMLEYFGKYKTYSPLLTGKRSSTPLAFLLILVLCQH